MAGKRIRVRDLAAEAALDVDEVLVALWDEGFDDITTPEDFLGRGEANRARRALGLATRRELGSTEYWRQLFQVSNDEFQALLAELGVENAFDGGRLRKRALRRLRAEAITRGIWQPSDRSEELTPSDEEVEAPLVWEQIGHKREMRYLTNPEVESFHDALVCDFAASPDPIMPPGIKDRTLLASAVHRPHTANGSTLKYPTVEMAASALLHALVHNHPFHNGNKRVATVAMLVFLDENGLALTCTQDDLFKLVLRLAQHSLVEARRGELADREVLAVADWLRTHARRLERGDRAMSFRRLRQILIRYGCEFDLSTGVGNRVNISRRIEKHGLLGRVKVRVLHTQTFRSSSGCEVQQNSVNRIRHELELDDEHGVDSRAFYDNDPVSVDDFIVQYRKLLRRLAKL